MIQELDKTNFFKGIVADPAENTEKDMQILQDMIDTMIYLREKNKDEGFAMTANMIGANKRIMIFYDVWEPYIVINPTVIDKEEFLTPEEIEKERAVAQRDDEMRDFRLYHSHIALEYYNEKWEKKRTLFRNMYGEIKELLDRLDGIF